MDPLGVDMYLVRAVIVTFGYVCWSSVVVIGLLSGAMLFVHAFLAGLLHAARSCASPRVARLLQVGVASSTRGPSPEP